MIENKTGSYRIRVSACRVLLPLAWIEVRCIARDTSFWMDVNIGPEACSHCCSCIWRAAFAASGEWWVVRCAQSQLLSQVFHMLVVMMMMVVLSCALCTILVVSTAKLLLQGVGVFTLLLASVVGLSESFQTWFSFDIDSFQNIKAVPLWLHLWTRLIDKIELNWIWMRAVCRLLV